MNLEMVTVMDWKENQLMIPDQTNITFSFVIISPQKLTFSGHVVSADGELGQNYYSWQNCLKKKKKATDRVDEQDQGDYRILFVRATGYY